MLRNVEETMRNDADFIKYLNPSSVVLANDFVGPMSEVSGASSAKFCPTRAAITVILSAAHAAVPPPPHPPTPRARRSLLYEACTSDYVCELLYDTSFCFLLQFPLLSSCPLSRLVLAALQGLFVFHTCVRCTYKEEEQQGNEPRVRDPLGNIYQVVLCRHSYRGVRVAV
jgi:hypothetical protein